MRRVQLQERCSQLPTPQPFQQRRKQRWQHLQLQHTTQLLIYGYPLPLCEPRSNKGYEPESELQQRCPFCFNIRSTILKKYRNAMTMFFYSTKWCRLHELTSTPRMIKEVKINTSHRVRKKKGYRITSIMGRNLYRLSSASLIHKGHLRRWCDKSVEACFCLLHLFPTKNDDSSPIKS